MYINVHLLLYFLQWVDNIILLRIQRSMKIVLFANIPVSGLRYFHTRLLVLLMLLPTHHQVRIALSLAIQLILAVSPQPLEQNMTNFCTALFTAVVASFAFEFIVVLSCVT